LATDFDSFATQIPVGGFVDSGVDRDYFVIDQVGTVGPFSASVYRADIDLSALGVPVGSAVDKIRLTTTNGGADILGVTATIPEPSIQWMLISVVFTFVRRRNRA
jgi:hypothetical protein